MEPSSPVPCTECNWISSEILTSGTASSITTEESSLASSKDHFTSSHQNHVFCVGTCEKPEHRLYYEVLMHWVYTGWKIEASCGFATTISNWEISQLVLLLVFSLITAIWLELGWCISPRASLRQRTRWRTHRERHAHWSTYRSQLDWQLPLQHWCWDIIPHCQG